MRPKVNKLKGTGRWRLDLRDTRYDVVRDLLANGRQRLNFTSEEAARTKAREIERTLRNHGIAKLQSVQEFIKGEGNLKEYAEALAVYGKTIADACQHYLGWLREDQEKRESKLFADVADEWVASKNSDTLKRKRTKSTVTSAARLFRAEFGERRIATITPDELQHYLNTLQVRNRQTGAWVSPSRQTVHHYRSHLSQLFNFAVGKEYVPKNPVRKCERIKVGRREKDHFDVATCVLIMEQCLKPRWMPYLPYHAICLFAGVRPSECEQLGWKDVSFEHGDVFVPAKISKTHDDRRIPMQPNLVRWLQFFRSEHPQAPLIPTCNFNDSVRRFRRELGLWIPDGLRHSFASFHLAKFESLDRVQLYTGTSLATLRKHYLRRPPKADADAFWGIVPPDEA